MKLLFILFIVLPVTELMVLIKVGSFIGVLNTLGVVLLTAFIGAALLRQQGLDTFMRANQRLQAGDMPATELAEGLMLAFGGALLLTPGFITDTFGFLLLIPQTRQAFAKIIVKQFAKSGAMHFQAGFQQPFEGMHGQNPFDRQQGSHHSNPYGASQRDDIIDGEFEEIRDHKQINHQEDKKN